MVLVYKYMLDECVCMYIYIRIHYSLHKHHKYVFPPLAGHTHLSLEAALGKSLWLISWCTQTVPLPLEGGAGRAEHAQVTSSTKVMAYSIVMETILSKVKCYK